jgi:hypothetical protein
MNTRRTFVTRSFAALAALPFVGILSSCSLESVWTAIQKYVPLGLSAFSAVLSILSGADFPIGAALAGIIALVQKAFGDLQAAVADYQSAPSGAKQGLIAKVSEALTIIEANLQSFWNGLSIPDAKLEGVIEGLIGVIVTTLQGFAAALPTSQTPAANAARAARASLPKIAGGAAKRRSEREFKKDFNAVLGDDFKEHRL